MEAVEISVAWHWIVMVGVCRHRPSFCLFTDDRTGYFITVGVPAGGVAIFNASFFDESEKFFSSPGILLE